MSIDHDRLKEICEALIFVSEEPLSFRKIQAILEGVPAPELRKVLGELVESWGQREGGFLLVEVAEGYQFRTRSENVEWVRMLVKYKPAKLSKAALETLAIVAYNQPVTRPEVEAIRGVDCSSSLSQLLEKGLVKILGRKDVPGKPFIYGTTPKFLEVMGLRDLGQLPTLREIEESEILQLEEFENEGIISENKGKEDGAEPDSQDSAPLDSEDGDEPDGDDQEMDETVDQGTDDDDENEESDEDENVDEEDIDEDDDEQSDDEENPDPLDLPDEDIDPDEDESENE